MKFNIFFLCKSFLDSSDVTPSLTLSDHISIFNSNNRETAIFASIKSLASFSDVDSTGLQREISLASFASAQKYLMFTRHSWMWHTLVSIPGRRAAEEEEKKRRCWPFRDKLEVWGELFPRCLGGILESRFAHKAALTLSRSWGEAPRCNSTSDSGFKLCNPLS